MRVEAISIGCQDINHSEEPSVTEISPGKLSPLVDGVKTEDLENRVAFDELEVKLGAPKLV